MFASVTARVSLLHHHVSRRGENAVASRRRWSRRKASSSSSSITRASGGGGGGGDDDSAPFDDEDKEDDLPPPIKLNQDQARIAALAFEVLYEKDPLESLEELLVDKERPGLRFRLTQAIKAANEACKGGASVECAAAWEEVDGLEDAAMRAGMTQNAPNSAYSPTPAPPKTPPSKSNAAAEKKKKEKEKMSDLRMSNPATRAGVDPLAGMMPCFNESCEAPQGDFQKRADLERLLDQSGKKAGGHDASEGRLTDAIREAVDVAITMCENWEDPSQCAVAWEVVEELSASANKRKKNEGESSSSA